MVQRDSFRLAIRAMRNVCLLVGLGLLVAVFGCGRAPKEGNDHAAKLETNSEGIVDGSDPPTASDKPRYGARGEEGALNCLNP